MTPRELVIESLAHRRSATVPYDVQFTRPARERMAAWYGEADFEAKIGNCLAMVRARTHRQVRPDVWQDHFGVQWDRSVDSDIGQVVRPLVSPATLEDYAFPDADDPALYADFDRDLAASAGRFVVVKLSYSLFERAWSLVGMEDLLMHMIADKAFVHALLDRIVEYNLRYIANVCRPGIDAVFVGDDWGHQGGVIMGPALWREFIKPRVRAMYQGIRQRGKVVFAHCCGRVQELFDDLIECGLDVFNPLQPEVMDVYDVKERFGERLSFYGGISIQRTLPFGSVQDVRDEVRRLLDRLGRDGGYIASPAHAIPRDAKVENIAAMIETLQDQ